uniref:Uncharacterized protein n=1 Tax=Toxoplasma gondii COUG TaxID=1074873 RepID=A0A2G8XYI5_TOXGO|nr:hypothetical protein TGCOUG_213560 [Toxoplasma gondii COUG]
MPPLLLVSHLLQQYEAEVMPPSRKFLFMSLAASVFPFRDSPLSSRERTRRIEERVFSRKRHRLRTHEPYRSCLLRANMEVYSFSEEERNFGGDWEEETPGEVLSGRHAAAASKSLCPSLASHDYAQQFLIVLGLQQKRLEDLQQQRTHLIERIRLNTILRSKEAAAKAESLARLLKRQEVQDKWKNERNDQLRNQALEMLHWPLTVGSRQDENEKRLQQEIMVLRQHILRHAKAPAGLALRHRQSEGESRGSKRSGTSPHCSGELETVENVERRSGCHSPDNPCNPANSVTTFASNRNCKSPVKVGSGSHGKTDEGHGHLLKRFHTRSVTTVAENVNGFSEAAATNFFPSALSASTMGVTCPNEKQVSSNRDEQSCATEDVKGRERFSMREPLRLKLLALQYQQEISCLQRPQRSLASPRMAGMAEASLQSLSCPSLSVSPGDCSSSSSSCQRLIVDTATKTESPVRELRAEQKENSPVTSQKRLEDWNHASRDKDPPAVGERSSLALCSETKSNRESMAAACWEFLPPQSSTQRDGLKCDNTKCTTLSKCSGSRKEDRRSDCVEPQTKLKNPQPSPNKNAITGSDTSWPLPRTPRETSTHDHFRKLASTSDLPIEKPVLAVSSSSLGISAEKRKGTKDSLFEKGTKQCAMSTHRKLDPQIRGTPHNLSHRQQSPARASEEVRASSDSLLDLHANHENSRKSDRISVSETARHDSTNALDSVGRCIASGRSSRADNIRYTLHGDQDEVELLLQGL